MSPMRSNSSIAGNGRPSAAASSSGRIVRGPVATVFCGFSIGGLPFHQERTAVRHLRLVGLSSPTNPRSVRHALASLFRHDSGPDDALRRRPPPDFDALVRTGRDLVEAGMSAAGLLRIDGRLAAPDRRAADGGRRAPGRTPVCPVIVGTGAQNTAAGRSARRATPRPNGARGLMIIPRVLSRGSSPAAQRSHFAQRSGGGGRPAFGHLQQPLLRLPDARRTVLRSCEPISPISSDSRNSAARSR